MKTVLLCAFALAAGGNVLLAQSSAEAEIRALEAKWDEAQLKGDANALAEIFADTYVSTNPEGKTRGKAEVINEVKSGDIKFQTSKVQDLKIMLYGDTAVVSGIWKGKFVQKGKPMDLTERFTDTFVRQGGKWRCVASHASALKQ